MNTGNISNDEANVIGNFIEQLNKLKMKTAMQELAEWLETPNVWGENNFSVRNKVKQLLEKEKEQIISSFDMGKSRAYATADNECEVKFGFNFYNETYTENDD